MMDNVAFVNYLQDLSTNRFALNALNKDEFYAFYCWLLAQFNINTTNQWYLLGTDGCHLCHIAHQSIQDSQHNAIYLELMNANDMVIHQLGKLIPILLTPYGLLCYPFGIMDVINIAQLNE